MSRRRERTAHGNELGFTLLEMVVVVALLTMTIAALVGWETNAVHGAEARAAMQQFKAYVDLTRSYARTTGNGATLYVHPDPNDSSRQLLEVLKYRPMATCPLSLDPTFCKLDLSQPYARTTIGAYLTASTNDAAFAIFFSSSGSAAMSSPFAPDYRLVSQPPCDRTISLSVAHGKSLAIDCKTGNL